MYPLVGVVFQVSWRTSDMEGQWRRPGFRSAPKALQLQLSGLAKKHRLKWEPSGGNTTSQCLVYNDKTYFRVRSRCPGCRKDPEFYMVKRAVWEREAGLHYLSGRLCIRCLEKTLGRTLEFKDFNWSALNVVFFMTTKAGIRMLRREDKAVVDRAFRK